MDKADLKRIAVDAAMERVIGSSTVPIKYLKTLIEGMGTMVDENKIAAREAKDAVRAAEKAAKAVEKYESTLSKYWDEIERVSQIKRGVDGKDGRDGVDGRDGRDALVDLDSIARMAASLIEKPAPGKPGKDAVLSEKMLEKAVEKYLKNHAERLENEVASYRNQLAGKHYGENTWARGSGTTVSAGANITLVPRPDGTVQINASGGGSGTNVTTQYQLTAVQAGSDVTIDLSQLANFATYVDLIALYRNNVMQTETLNFTVSGSTVTVLFADASEIFNITYSYA